MVIVDSALEKRYREGNPVRVALVGAGYMGRGIALEIISAMPGMKLVAVCNRHIARAEQAYQEAGVDSYRAVSTVAELEEAVRDGRYAVT